MHGFKIIIVLLILAFFLQGCTTSQTSQDTDILSHLLDDYLKSIENGIPNDMCLTIYYSTPYVSADMPVDEERLIIWGSTSEDASIAGKVVIDSTQLTSRIDQLQKIDAATLQKPIIKRYKDLRIYYYIETESAGKVLEVGMFGRGGTTFVNDVQVMYNPVFFDLVSPELEELWGD